MKRPALLTTLMLAALALALPGASAETTAPPAPQDLAAEVLEDGSVLLSWADPGLDLQYNVYRNGDLMATTEQTSHLDEQPLHVSMYQVTAEDSGVESEASAPIFVFTTGGSDSSYLLPPGLFDDLPPLDLFGGNSPPSPSCPILVFSTNSNNPPFVFVAFNDRCLPSTPLFP